MGPPGADYIMPYKLNLADIYLKIHPEVDQKKDKMPRPCRPALLLMLAAAPFARAATQLTIATVNNGDMIIMQRLSREFEKQNPDIRLDWVILEENVLRARVTTDIATARQPVRHPDHRNLRNPDLGQARMADAPRRGSAGRL